MKISNQRIVIGISTLNILVKEGIFQKDKKVVSSIEDL